MVGPLEGRGLKTGKWNHYPLPPFLQQWAHSAEAREQRSLFGRSKWPKTAIYWHLGILQRKTQELWLGIMSGQSPWVDKPALCLFRICLNITPGQQLPKQSLYPRPLPWTLDPNSTPPLRIIHCQFKLNMLEIRHWTSTSKPVPPAVSSSQETANPFNQFFRPEPLKASLGPLSLTPWFHPIQQQSLNLSLRNTSVFTTFFTTSVKSTVIPHVDYFNSFLSDIQFWSPHGVVGPLAAQDGLPITQQGPIQDSIQNLTSHSE